MIGEWLNDVYPIREILKSGYFMIGRQARELPKIDIGGTMFYLDLRLNEFRECENFMNRMNLNKLNETEGGYEVCFDPKTKNYFEGSKEEFERRKDDDLVCVNLPTLQDMDPLGFGWLMEEFGEGSSITVRPQVSKAYHENESNQVELELDKAGLLFIKKNHPPLLEQKKQLRSKGKKL